MSSSRSHDLLLGELGLVLVFDTEVLDLGELLLLDGLQLKAVFLELLADALALLQVVEPLLLALLTVLADLLPKVTVKLLFLT